MKRKLIFCVSILFLFVFFSKGEAMGEKMELPEAKTKGKISLEEAVAGRRSVRRFAAGDLTKDEISQLLWAAQGITDSDGAFRSAPSAGALYPMEIYLVSKNGNFHYLPEGHKLEVLSKKDLREALAGAALGQSAVKDAAIDIIICAVFKRITVKYKERGVRYAYMEAGHIAQNIHLQAVALGLGSVPIGAFDDKEVAEVLSLPGDCHPLYVIPLGRKNSR